MFDAPNYRKRIAVFVGSAVFALLTAAAAHAVWAQTITVATVNIANPMIVSQEGSTFALSFEISNREGMQAGVKYGVELVSESAGNGARVDNHVYEETLTLPEHSNFKKEITYTAPPNLSGSYALYFVVKNQSGFPLASVRVGMVTLARSAAGLAIIADSCFLQVVGEKGSPQYTLFQGVDITQDETLRLTCTAENSATSSLFALPRFETRYRSVYGEVVPHEGGDSNALTFAPQKKKVFSLALPKALEPQAYDVLVSLDRDGIRTNVIDVHYVLQGKSATIQGISPDKDYYQRGDTAVISFLWTPSAGGFSGARHADAPQVSAVKYDIILTDGAGKSCAAPFQGVLSDDMKQEARVPIISACENPKVAVSLADTGGEILDRQEPQFTSTPRTQGKLILTFIFVLALLATGAYVLKKKGVFGKRGGGGAHLRALLPFLMLILAGSMLPPDEVCADTASYNYGGQNYSMSYTVTNTAGQITSSQPPGGNLRFVGGSWVSSQCGNYLSWQPQTTYVFNGGMTEGIRTVNLQTNSTSGIAGVPISFPITVTTTLPPDPPSVITLPATGVTGTTATLNGSANPHGVAATGWFRYYTTPPASCVDSGGIKVPASTPPSGALGSVSTYVSYSSNISSLVAGTTYHYCAFASNVSGTRAGTVEAFVAPGTGPTALTLPATNVAASTATLNGSANPNGFLTFGWFRYSPTNPNFCSNSNFASGVFYDGGNNSYDMATVDLNGDGWPDLVMTNASSNTISVFINNKNGTFQTKVDYGGLSGPFDLDIGDFNGDGRPDIVVANSSSQNFSVFMNNGNGNLDPVATNYAVSVGNINGVNVADLNGDGRPDIVVKIFDNTSTKNIGVFLNNNGAFLPVTRYGINMYNVSVRVGDVTGDGKPDIVTTGSYGTPYLAFSVLINNGSGDFSSVVTNNITHTPDRTVFLGPVADLNGDGLPDIVASLVDPDNSVYLYIFLNSGDGTGTFPVQASYSSKDSGGDYYSIGYSAIGDMNGDNKPDLVVSTYVKKGFKILFNEGNGVFAPATNYAYVSNDEMLLIGKTGAISDVNGDGKPDIVAVRHDQTLPPYVGKAAVYINDAALTPNTSLGITNPSPYSFNISSLDSGTTYYYCAIASNAWGVALGNIMSFITGSASPPSVSATINGVPSLNIPSGDPFTLKMTSTNADSCTWSQTTNGSPNFTNAAIPAVDGGPTRYEHDYTSSFAATNAWEWTFTCTNSAGTASSVARLFMDAANVVVSTSNTPPTASAGPDQTISVPSAATPSGSGSDSEGPVTYSWGKSYGDASGSISGSDTANPTITGLTAGTHRYTLVVTDSNGATASDEVEIIVNNVTTYTITVSAGAGGTISPGSATVNSGGSQSFTITPYAGYSITSVFVDGSSVGTVSLYNFSGVTSNHTISATFNTICFNGYDAAGNPFTRTLDSSYDRVPTEPSWTYRVTRYSPTRCFGNSGTTKYLVPLNTQAEFDAFWAAIPRLTGLYVIP
ncbi:MAG: FG-GAP-like repeat-containing protein [bacterium]|nr:FG-GAP-like repeat-containing protein [bacterium]